MRQERNQIVVKRFETSAQVLPPGSDFAGSGWPRGRAGPRLYRSAPANDTKRSHAGGNPFARKSSRARESDLMTHHQLVLVVDLVRNVEKQPVFERMLRRTLGRALERDLLAFAGSDNRRSAPTRTYRTSFSMRCLTSSSDIELMLCFSPPTCGSRTAPQSLGTTSRHFRREDRRLRSSTHLGHVLGLHLLSSLLNGGGCRLLLDLATQGSFLELRVPATHGERARRAHHVRASTKTIRSTAHLVASFSACSYICR